MIAEIEKLKEYVADLGYSLGLAPSGEEWVAVAVDVSGQNRVEVIAEGQTDLDAAASLVEKLAVPGRSRRISA